MIDRQRFLADLGRRLREARELAGLSVTDVARRAHISRRHVTEAEAGRANPSVLKLAELALALTVPLGDLFDPTHPSPGRSGRGSERIALVGLRGAGKSTIGRKLALALEVPFVELDARVEQLASLTLSEVFAIHGAEGFHRFEAEALESVLAEGERFVLAVGGSIVDSAPTFRRLCAACRTVWLRADARDHMQRVIDQGDRRPMQNRPRALAELEAILAARASLYAQCEHQVWTSGASVDETVEAVMAFVLRSA
jgi:XRE family aerobic/anaerobic benzoate catabolism transcriptional regulator